MKKIISILLIILVLLACTGCNAKVKKAEENKSFKQTSMFIIIEQTENWYVVYHKDTKVMYQVSKGRYNSGVFTLLVDAENNPMIYEGE